MMLFPCTSDIYLSVLTITNPPGKVFLRSLGPGLSIAEDGTWNKFGSTYIRHFIAKATESRQICKKNTKKNHHFGGCTPKLWFFFRVFLPITYIFWITYLRTPSTWFYGVVLCVLEFVTGYSQSPRLPWAFFRTDFSPEIVGKWPRVSAKLPNSP